MLNFYSASTRMANPDHAILECLHTALGESKSFNERSLIILNASIGHDLKPLHHACQQHCPNARIIGSSCAGIVGKEGVSESMKDVAMMAITGNEFSIFHADDVNGCNTFEKSKQIGQRFAEENPDINMMYVIASGIDISNDQLILGLEAGYEKSVPIFGANSSDSMKGIVSFQGLDSQIFEHSIVVVGFSDPSISVQTQATHGFIADGAPMTVTKSSANRIIELDNRPAWEVYSENLGLPITASLGDSIPIGAMGVELDDALAQEYGNTHILNVVTHLDNQSLVFPINCPVGTKLWLTVRDEEKIFNDMDRMTQQLVSRMGGAKPIAVFQADCLARGRALFNRIIKEELVQRMQFPFSDGTEVPAWLGMYGFGEFAYLGGRNRFHNYTTSLAVLYRKSE